MKHRRHPIYLRTDGGYFFRFGNCSSAENQRNSITLRFVTHQTVRVRITMIRHQHNNRAVPHRSHSERINHRAQTTVAIGYCVQERMVKMMIIHLERFVRRKRQYDIKMRVCVLTRSDITPNIVKDYVIGHAPFGQSVRDRKRMVRHTLLKTACDQVRTHVREIFIASVVEFQLIAIGLQYLADLRQALRLRRHTHHRRGRATWKSA